MNITKKIDEALGQKLNEASHPKIDLLKKRIAAIKKEAIALENELSFVDNIPDPAGLTKLDKLSAQAEKDMIKLADLIDKLEIRQF